MKTPGAMSFTNEAATTDRVICELQGAIHAASSDYFAWSRGHILYDKGVESLMQVYSAKRLFEFFRPEHEITVHLERRCIELVPGLIGRIDMTLEFSDGALYAIELKRYSSPAQIRSDLARLREVVAAASGRVGLLAAPCYMKERESDYDWPLRQKREAEVSPGQIWHLSEPLRLPEAGHSQGWSHERVLVVQVCQVALDEPPVRAVETEPTLNER